MISRYMRYVIKLHNFIWKCDGRIPFRINRRGLDGNVTNDHQEVSYNVVAVVEDGNDLFGF